MREITGVRVELDYSDGTIERHSASEKEVRRFIQDNPLHWALIRQYLSRISHHSGIKKTD